MPTQSQIRAAQVATNRHARVRLMAEVMEARESAHGACTYADLCAAGFSEAEIEAYRDDARGRSLGSPRRPRRCRTGASRACTSSRRLKPYVPSAPRFGRLQSSKPWGFARDGRACSSSPKPPQGVRLAGRKLGGERAAGGQRGPPSKWGNPHRVGADETYYGGPDHEVATAEQCVALYERHLEAGPSAYHRHNPSQA